MLISDTPHHPLTVKDGVVHRESCRHARGGQRWEESDEQSNLWVRLVTVSRELGRCEVCVPV